VIGQKMLENWGQQVIVETRPGAATVIGTGAAAKADPDGYTLIIVVSNHATNPALNANLPYDPIKDFEFITLLGRAPMVPYVNPKFPPQNLNELVAYGKTNPVPFGSAGLASMTHLLAETLKAQNDIKLMQHVVYKGGMPALNDVLAGQIPMTFGTVTQAAAVPGKARTRVGGQRRQAPSRYPGRADVPRAGLRHRVTGGTAAGAGRHAGADRRQLNAEMRRILRCRSANAWRRLTLRLHAR
jgi:tripartite-type tricarboxylate transporter receptor subunit TctC